MTDFRRLIEAARWTVALPALLGLLATSATAQISRGVAFCRDTDVFYLRPWAKTPDRIGKGMSPAVSPNGQAIAFLSLTGTVSESKTIQLVTMGGGNRTLYTAPRKIRALQWSPTGAMLAFLMDEGNDQALYTIAVPGFGAASKPKHVITGGRGSVNSIFMPRWHPDGASLIFHDISHVFRVDLSGKILENIPVEKFTGKPTNVDSLGSFLVNPANRNEWAYIFMVPGTKKFEQTFGEPNSALFIMDRSTGKRVRLTPVDMVANDPVWSPDGKFLFVVGYREPHYKQQFPFRIYRVNRDGTGLTEIGKGDQPST